MERVPVRSSNLRSVGYDPDTQALEIEFHSQRVYLYFGVPEHIHQGLMSALSKGRYHDRYIKDRYRYTQVR